MSPYHPPQREVSALVLSVSRWLRATFHLPQRHAFDDHLGKGRSFYPLTDVAFTADSTIPFLALRASAVHVVVPAVDEKDLLLSSPAGARPREVSCYLENLAVHGRLDLLPGVRTSDFLAHQEGFITLRACRIVPAIQGLGEPVPVLFVNALAIVGVTEEAEEAEARKVREGR